MRNALLVIASIGLIALQGTVEAEPSRACAEVSSRIEVALRPALVGLAEHQPDGATLGAQLHACLNSRNICGVAHDGRNQKDQLVAADTTADLPVQYAHGREKSFVIFLVRSIPRVRNDSNQYCLVTEQSPGEGASVKPWEVYGWVLAPKGGETLPLQKEVLDHKAGSPLSLRGLAAALWFFAARMSGEPPR
jgi:hypothetical protein